MAARIEGKEENKDTIQDEVDDEEAEISNRMSTLENEITVEEVKPAVENGAVQTNGKYTDRII